MPNTLFYGDNLEVMRDKIKDETVDLCYIDPPFNSNRDYFQIYNNIFAPFPVLAHSAPQRKTRRFLAAKRGCKIQSAPRSGTLPCNSFTTSAPPTSPWHSELLA
jgi:hypothetical protein